LAVAAILFVTNQAAKNPAGRNQCSRHQISI
jgi:hypothetical protein